MSRPTTVYAVSIKSIFHYDYHIFIMIIIYNDFQRFWGSKFLNGCFSSLANVCVECNNFQDSRQMFMTSDFKVFPKILLRQLNFGQFKNYVTFITKKKLYFSLTYSFYSCSVKKGSALKVAQQFAIRGLVAYKKSVYQLNDILFAIIPMEKHNRCVIWCRL